MKDKNKIGEYMKYVKVLLASLVMLTASFAVSQVPTTAFTGTIVKQYTFTMGPLDYQISGIRPGTTLFPGLNFTCPGTKANPKQCYIDITVYVGLENFLPQDAGDEFMMQVYLDENPSHALYPINPVGVDATSYGLVSQTRSATWTSELLSSAYPHNFILYGFLLEPLGTAELTYSKLSATLYLYTGPAN